MKKQEEEFRDIPGFEGYQVSNLGRVKSLPREMLLHGKYPYISKEKILTCHINTGGYYQIRLISGNNRYSKTVHTLISRAFLNHIPNGTHKIVVDHINGIRTDNRLENLQLITNRENVSKDKKNGTSKYTGVYWCKTKNKFTAKIRINRTQKNLGTFNTEEEASKYYQNALKAIENNEEIISNNKNKTSIYKGVSFNKASNKWGSFIQINGKSKYLGYFKTELEAHNAYQNKLSEINSKLN